MRTPIVAALPFVLCATVTVLSGPAFSQQPVTPGGAGRALRQDVFPDSRRDVPSARSVRGPILGFAVDDADGVRLIRGMPGAASFSAPVASVRGLAAWAVSSERGYILGVPDRAGRLVLLRNLDALPERVELPADAGPGTLIALSPLGSAAAVFDAAGNRLIVFGGLPDHPFPRWRLATDALPGPIQALAVADEGGAVLAAAGKALVRLRPAAAWEFVAPLAGSARLAFVPGRDEAVYLDGVALEAALVRFTASGVSLEPLFGGRDGLREPVAVAVGSDARIVYVADAALPGVYAFDLRSHILSTVRSPHEPVTLARLRGARLFRLTTGASGPVYLYDGSRGAPHVAFIPAAVDAIGGGEK